MTVEELQVLITANSADLQNEIKKMQGQLGNLEKTTAKSSGKMLTSFKVFKAGLLALGIGKIISNIANAISNELGAAISRVDTMNNYSKVMGNLGISSRDAQDSITVLKEKLLGLPTTLDDAASAVQRFASANGNVKASTSMFLALNNAILAGGASTEIQKSALEQLSQAYAKGKPDMMEWRTAMMAMPAQLKQVGLAMGYASADQLGEALRSGTVSMNEFMVMLTKLNKEGANGFKSFEEQARNATGGIQTSMLNVRTSIQRGLADIMDAIGQSNIAGFFNMIRRAIDAVIPYIAGFVKAMVQAVSIISRLFGGKGIKKSADEATGSMDNLGSSVGGVSNDLDSATGSAKKLNKELHGLASFDEMNVLKEQDTSSGGGSGGGSSYGTGGIGEIDLSMFDDLEAKTSKADEIAEKIMKAFRNVFDYLKSLDFSGIIGHIKGIGTSIVEIFTSEKVKTAATNWVNSTVNYVKTVVTSIIQVGKNVAEGFLGAIDTYLKQQKDRITNFIANMFNISVDFENMFGGLYKAFAEISEVFKTDAFKQIGADIINIFVDPIMTATEVIAKFARDFINIFVQPIVDNSTKLKETLEQTLGPIQRVFDTLSNAISYMGETFNQVYDEHLKPLFDSLSAGLSDTFSKFLDVYNEYIQPFIDRMSVMLQDLWDNHLKGLWDNLMELFASIGDALKVFWEQWLKPLIDWIIKNIVPIIVPILEKIGTVIGAVFSIIVDVISAILGVLGGLIDFLVGVFTGDWDKAWGGIKKIFESIWNMISSIFKTVVDTMKKIWTSTGESIKATLNAVGNWIKSKFEWIRDTIHNVMNAIHTGISNVWNGILNTIRGVINGILGGIETMCNGIIRGLNKILTPLTKVGNTILKAVGIKSFSFSTLSEISIPRLETGMNFVPKDYFGPVYLDYGERVLTKEENEEFNSSKTPQKIVINVGNEKVFDDFIDYMNEKSFETNGEVCLSV